jgi:hypothetical protein
MARLRGGKAKVFEHFLGLFRLLREGGRQSPKPNYGREHRQYLWPRGHLNRFHDVIRIRLVERRPGSLGMVYHTQTRGT